MSFSSFLEPVFLLSLLPAALVGSLGLFIALGIVRERVGFSRVLIVSFVSAYSIPLLYELFTIPIPLPIVNLILWIVLSRIILRLSIFRSVIAGLGGYGIYFILALIGVDDFISEMLETINTRET